jgi:hypothetical protein
MGADLWQHEAEWQPDPAAALRQFQLDLFQKQHNFQEEFDSIHQSAKDALQLTRKEGDRFNLAAIYEQELKVIEAFTKKPLPTEPAEQFAVLREILPEGFGSILDVTGIDETGDVNVMRLLPPEEISQLVGSEKPMAEAIAKSFARIVGNLGRGDSVAFAVYDDKGNPVRWHFVGLTVD